MDRHRFSAIAHQDHVLYSPIDEQRLDRLLAALALTPDQRALDLGCGQAEILIRLVERYGITAEGVDAAAGFLARARQRAADRIPADRLVLHEADAHAFTGAPGGYDLVICIGGPFGMQAGGLAALTRLTRPGGMILVGAGFWQQEPHPDYLAATGIPREEMQGHADNIATAVATGLNPLYTLTSSEADWDHYEGLYLWRIERHIARHPDDPDAPAMAGRIRTWRDAYFCWGRSTLGFGLYLLGRPPEGAP